MKQKIKRFLSMFVVLSVIMSALPMQYALAADADSTNPIVTKDNMSVIRGNESALSTSGFKGHVLRLTEESVPTEDNSDTIYDAKIEVSLKDADAFQNILLSFGYNAEDVTPVSPYEGVEFNPSDTLAYSVGIGQVTNAMTTTSTYLKDPISKAPKLLTDLLFGGTSGGFFSITTGKTQEETVGGSAVTYNQMLCNMSLNPSIDSAKWTTSTNNGADSKSVAAASTYGSGITYKFAAGETQLYTLYFKKNPGKNITASTFNILYDSENGVPGSAAVITNNKAKGEYFNQSTYMIGFPVPAEPDQTVNFTEVKGKDGTKIQDAKIYIYSDSERTTQVTGSPITTNAEGKATITLPANTTYYYTIKYEKVPETYVDTLGQFNVAKSTVNVDPIEVLKPAEVEYDVSFTTVNADTGAAIGSVLLKDGSNDLGTTGSDGTLTGKKLTAGSHTITATVAAGGYDSTQQIIDVSTTEANNFTIPVNPTYNSIQLPTVQDSSSQAISGAAITVDKVKGGDTNKWGTSNTYNSGESITLPRGATYKVTATATGYGQYSYYITINADGTSVTYSNDADGNDTIASAPTAVTIEKMADPYYKVNVSEDAANAGTYKVEVSLNNINAQLGTFGLQYDKNLFTFQSFQLENTDKIALLKYGTSGQTIPSGLEIPVASTTDSIGYHVFMWQAKVDGDIAATFDTTVAGGQKVATYTFTMNLNKSKDDIKTNSFTVMPYDKTANGAKFIAADGYAEAYESMLIENWRYTDQANVPDYDGAKLADPARLYDSKATLGGFYQVFAAPPTGTDKDPTYCDVITQVNYDEDIAPKKASLNFAITDEDNIPLSGAEIKVYNEDGTLATTLTTGDSGMVSYAVDTSESDKKFTYTVSCDGYWFIDKAETPVTVSKTTPPAVVNETVKMTEKIYHTPELQYSDDNSLVPTTEATLSGNPFAYNDTDYYFNISPASGKMFDEPTPNQLTVEIYEFGNNTPVNTYTASFDAAENMYKVPAAQITGARDTTADTDGYPSGKIVIKIAKANVTEDNTTYDVTAIAGTHGKVSYTADAGDADAVADATHTTPAAGSITLSDITPGKNVNKLTFTGDLDGSTQYYVEKVFVNGVQIHDYDNKTTFDYKFDNISRDNSISVVFWDKVTPSSDSVVTLVVGDKGSVDVTAPTPGETGISNTTRTYLFTAPGTLAFTPTVTDSTNYEIAEIKKVDNKTNTSSALSAPYSVAVGTGEDITVYVTFKAKGEGAPPINVYVKAYVKSGQGTVTPPGIIICNRHDSPSFTLTPLPGDDWMTDSVEIKTPSATSTAPVSHGTTAITYTLPSVTENTDLGVIFKETAYTVNGLISFDEGKTITTGDISSNAKITFVRTAGGDAMTKETYTTTTARKDNPFTIDLPKGTWTVTVSKRGFVNQIITGFVIDGSKNTVYFGAADESAGPAKAIVPYIGDTTGDGKNVSLTDAAIVANGLRTGAHNNVKLRADVDDNGSATGADMAYIKNNYGMRKITQSYSDFKN